MGETRKFHFVISNYLNIIFVAVRGKWLVSMSEDDGNSFYLPTFDGRLSNLSNVRGTTTLMMNKSTGL